MDTVLWSGTRCVIIDNIGHDFNTDTYLFIQNHTHSNPTTSSQASTYLTTKTLPLDNEDREDVKTLVDARVSSSHITNFLNDRIGEYFELVVLTYYLNLMSSVWCFHYRLQSNSTTNSESYSKHYGAGFCRS
eukprot:jgi/Phyca11/133559/e_gw1.551.1.1